MSEEVLSNIIFIILFIFPGIFIGILYKKFVPTSKKDPEGYEKIVGAFLYSCVVLFVNIIIIKVFFKNNISDINQLGKELNNFSFFFKYTLLSIVVSSITAYFFHKWNHEILLELLNKYRQATDKPVETKFQSVWESIFESGQMNDVCIVIEKDGEIITCGFLEEYSPPQNIKKELKLKYTQWVKKQFENDKNGKYKSDEEKIFTDIICEYFDYDSGILIKFYDVKKYLEYINSSAE